MKITSIEVLQISSQLQPDGPDGVPRPWRPIIVKMNTDEGITGYGEVGVAYGVGAAAGHGMAVELAKILIGQNPMNNEAIWERMMKKTFWGQGGGTMVFAGMSGIDIACWDIKGKALGVPLYQLLGGKTRTDLRCYASQIQFGWGNIWNNITKPEEYAEVTRQAVAEGYDCVKVDILENDYDGNIKMIDCTGVLPNRVLRMGIERLAAIREAAGDDVDIIVENHGETDVISAIQLANAIEKYNVMYYEEPCTPMFPKMMKEIKAKTNIPLAAGERVYSRWGFGQFFEDRSIDVIQPDLGTCGGLTEAKKLSDIAYYNDMKVQVHVCGSPIIKAAALHLETAIPNFIIHEHHRNALMEGNIAIGKYNYQPVNGRYTVPELPGLGQEITEEAYQNADKCLIK